MSPVFPHDNCNAEQKLWEPLGRGWGSYPLLLVPPAQWKLELPSIANKKYRQCLISISDCVS